MDVRLSPKLRARAASTDEKNAPCSEPRTRRGSVRAVLPASAARSLAFHTLLVIPAPARLRLPNLHPSPSAKLGTPPFGLFFQFDTRGGVTFIFFDALHNSASLPRCTLPSQRSDHRTCTHTHAPTPQVKMTDPSCSFAAPLTSMIRRPMQKSLRVRMRVIQDGNMRQETTASSTND